MPPRPWSAQGTSWNSTAVASSSSERLFALRAAARKHQVTVDDLPRLREEMAERLARIDAGAERLTAATEATRATRTAFAACVAELSEGRRAAAKRLAQAVLTELAPLKLDKARFAVDLIPLAEADWSGEGAERVGFEIATNPGGTGAARQDRLGRRALARPPRAQGRARGGPHPDAGLVFDEVDTGVGGAIADAVGERLPRLGASAQVLVVTHSPQVAAHGSSLARREGGARRSGRGVGDAAGQRAPRGDRAHAGRCPRPPRDARRRRQPHGGSA